ncbi:MAG: Ig-like domain-containing protein, partial [Limnochordia bacterium]
MFNKERLTLIALTLVALLLAGCGLFGPKSFDIVVRIEPPVEGVKIFVDGVHRATTEADGQVELNVKANAMLTAELEGYTFKQKELKVTEAGEYVFEIETSPGRKGAIVSVKTVLEDIQVWAGETPFEDLDLPSTVEVVLDDDEEVEVDVDWTAAEEDYDYETAGVYELEGVLVPGEGITNPDNITAKVKVVVEDKEPYDGAKDYLAGFFADYEEIGPDVDKLTLPTEIDLDDGVTAKVTWESNNPEVLDVDGAIKRTAEDVEVTLTGTITIEQAGPEGQAEEDPTVFTITVTVLADPELKAEALVEELEAIDGPKHYSEVADILKLIEDAKEAVEAITGNPELRDELTPRVLGVESKVKETLEGHVQAVLGAIGESGNPSKLFDALKAFWDAEEQYKVVYWYMVKFMDALEGINHDAIEPSDVDIIQEELIEKAPQVDAERLIVWEIVWAAKMTELPGSLSKFKGVLQQHADLFQRLNLEDDDDEYTVLNKYADSIVEFAFPPVSATLDDIQLAIDVANWEAFLDALVDAFDSVERDDLDRAEILFSYLTEDEVPLDKLGTPLSDIPDEEDGVMAYFAGLMAHLDLLLDIFEAETIFELWAALHAEGVEFEYLYEKLAEGYLKKIGTKYEGKANDSDWDWDDDDDFEKCLEQIEGIIQG